jgi:hypothetical protein
MENLTDLLLIPIAVIAIAFIIKWLRDLTLLSRAKYDQAIQEAEARYLLECRDMLNRIYYFTNGR